MATPRARTSPSLLASPSSPQRVTSRDSLYRRSTMVLNSLFGWPAQRQGQEDEREPLLQGQAGSEDHGPDGRYGSTSGSRRVTVPKPPKVKTPVRVEAKVWLANEVSSVRASSGHVVDNGGTGKEGPAWRSGADTTRHPSSIDPAPPRPPHQRTWISWLHVSLLIGSFALALFNSSSFFGHHHPDLPEDPTNPRHPRKNHALEPGTIKTFGIIYAGIAVLTLAWGLGNYLRRVHLIKKRYSGSFDDLIGPPLICTALFFAVLLNFIIRVQQHNLELP